MRLVADNMKAIAYVRFPLLTLPQLCEAVPPRRRLLAYSPYDVGPSTTFSMNLASAPLPWALF